MRFTYHVHTPLSRFGNVKVLLPMLALTPVIWHVVVTAEECRRVQELGLMSLPWVRVVVCDPLPPRDEYFPGGWKSNWFLSHTDLDERARYLLLNDDDYWPHDFINKLDAVDGSFLVCSMNRGVRQCYLKACAANMRKNRVGGEQLIVSGHLQRQVRYGTGYTGDWDMTEQLLRLVSPKFVPQAEVLFNYLEPGRFPDVRWP